MFKNIVVAYDGSESALRAFQRALTLAKEFDSSLTVLTVAQLAEPPAMVESSAALEEAQEQFERDFQKLRSQASAAGVELHTQIAVGHAAEQIVHYADQQKADLIVMGHRGKSRVAR